MMINGKGIDIELQERIVLDDADDLLIQIGARDGHIHVSIEVQ
jgi:hypothetical protein